MICASLFGPPTAAFLVFVRNGRTFTRSFFDSLYVLAVCMMVLVVMIFAQESLGLFGEDVGFALPIFVGIWLWLLLKPPFRQWLSRVTAAINMDDKKDADRS